MDYRKGITANLILIALLLFVTVLLYLPEKGGDETEPEQVFELVDLNVSRIGALAVINDNARFGLLHNKGQISLEPAVEGMSYSLEAMQGFLFRISKLQASALVQNPADDNSYGFDAPRAAITLILEGGEKRRLILGKENPLDGSSYLKREVPGDPDDSVYLISSGDAALFLADPSLFRSDSLLPAVELENLDILKSVSLDFSDPALSPVTVSNRGGFQFRLSRPFENTLNYERVLTDLVFPVLSLSSLRPSDVPAQSLSAENRILKMEVVLGNEGYSLSFFRDGGAVYVQNTVDSTAARLPEEEPGYLSLRFRDLLNGSIYHCNVSEIESLVIEDRDLQQDYNIILTGQSVELEGNINGIPVDYPRMTGFFETLLATGIAARLPEREAGTRERGEPLFSITIRKKNAGMDRLDFYPAEGDELVLSVNGEAHFTTYSKTVRDIHKALSELLQKEGA
ncbi:MAG: DUF4340 domain-containing protein [Spirochaetales bacterium]|nr:DUF4340 domain-containing protein [Spirochaetales bacterium]